MKPGKRIGPIDGRGWLQLVGVFILATLYFGILVADLASTTTDGTSPAAVWIGIGGGSLVGLLAVMFILWVWRRTGGRAEVRRRHEAIRSGELPDTIDAVAWLRSLNSLTQMAWLYRWMYPAMALLEIATVVNELIHHPGRVNSQFLVAATFVALAFYGVFFVRRRLPNIWLLIGELERRQTADAGAL